jgi:hypothetical protein
MVGGAVVIGLAVVAGWQTQTLNVNLTGLSERDQVVVRGAFGWWSSVTNLKFQFVSSDGPKTITVRWKPDWHGMGDGVMAAAFWPDSQPNSPGVYRDQWREQPVFDERMRWVAGDIHLNTVHRATFEASADAVFWVVLHEIGHSLGVAHLQCGPEDRYLMCDTGAWPEWSREDYGVLWEEYGWPDGRKGREEKGRK